MDRHYRYQASNPYAASAAVADGDDGDAAVDAGAVDAASVPVDAAAADAVATAAVDAVAVPQPRIARGQTLLPHSSSPTSRTKRNIIL